MFVYVEVNYCETLWNVMIVYGTNYLFYLKNILLNMYKLCYKNMFFYIYYDIFNNFIKD